MRHLLGPILLATALLGVSACGLSEDEARTILDGAERAGRENHYRGIVIRRFTLDDEERTTTVRIHHGPAGTRYEADRPGGRETWSHFSSRAPDIHWLRDRDLLLRSYRLVEEQTEVVAGRDAMRYRLKALRPDRPSRRFWLDVKTGVMLRDEGLDAAGRVIEAMHYETIEFGGDGPVPDLEVAGDGSTERETALREVPMGVLPGEVGFVPYRPGTLPEGFELLRCHVKDGVRRGAVLVYGDGLARFVISQRPTDAGDATGDASSPGDEVEVRREVRRGELRLGLRLDGTQIDVSSRTIGWDLLRDVVASLGRGESTES